MRAALLLAWACARPAPPAPAASAPTAVAVAAAPAPTFPLAYTPVDPTGAPVPFAQWAGRPVLVNLWATWCPPCHEELPALLAVQREHAPRGLVLVGLAVDDPPARVLATTDARGITWPQALDGSNRASVTFDTVELPTTLLYGPDGALLYKHVGVLSADDPALQQALSQALDQFARP
ncbi:TlpA family protein disulfide reductase [Myxococcota bacterium]|nr:TlpA family protein disulfide reductase [Myxococcota bacterium]